MQQEAIGVNSIGIGIVGFGKIAQDQHVGAIAASEHFSLRAIADPGVVANDAQQYRDIDAMLDSADAPDVIVVCTPPQVRFELARKALARRRHVLLEKPPCTTTHEAEVLQQLARDADVTLFCAWHSRFAPAVVPARDWLSDRQVKRVSIDWREDYRVWHPGQRWIWQEGGFGVFDPGINALSIATQVLPEPLVLTDALLRIPDDCRTPVAAELLLTDRHGLELTAAFDFLQEGRQTWEIEFETDRGRLRLLDGGSRLFLDGNEQELIARPEYERVYDHFSRLIAAGQSDVDLAPLRLVNDALTNGRREITPPLGE